MKLIIVLAVLLNLTITANSQLRKDTLIVLKLHNYPSKESIDYFIHPNGIEVKKLSPYFVDSILYSKRIVLPKFFTIKRKLLLLKKNKYANTHVQDGQIFTLTVGSMDSVKRRIRFDNAHNTYLKELIKMINNTVDSNFKVIYY